MVLLDKRPAKGKLDKKCKEGAVYKIWSPENRMVYISRDVKNSRFRKTCPKIISPINLGCELHSITNEDNNVEEEWNDDEIEDFSTENDAHPRRTRGQTTES